MNVESHDADAAVGVADPFGTAALRRRVLDGWAASPARFREDANAEEDLARGSYRDRVVVELAQNAADAATRAGVPGRLALRLQGSVLTASNTGAPLDAAGVESLSTLRASAKRERGSGEAAVVGRFGVGFASVLAVTDEPAVASTSGAVRWSLREAQAAASAVSELTAELEHRGGHVPVLRLPLTGDAAPEPGYDTTVRLPLRDDAALRLARRLLDDVDDALLLSLPGLAEIVVDRDGVRREIADAARWHVVRRCGPLDAQLLSDRPSEERATRTWSIAWARPLAGQPVPPTVHAPTATDEVLDLPALLIASFPLEPSRRHVAPGALTDFLVAKAADVYAELAASVEDPLSLVPTPAIAGALDGALRRAIWAAMAAAPLLPSADGGLVRARDAVSVVGADDALRGVLADVLPNLVADHHVLDRLGTRRLLLADVVDLLGDVERPPEWWSTLYDALHPLLPAAGADALGALPVPLADGRVVHGPRGLLFPGEPLPTGLDVLGLRIVHPAAAHPLLIRLGAVEATARTVLADPRVRAAVELGPDAPRPADVTDAVLALVDGAGLRPGELPWLRDLPMLDDDGSVVAAADLVLPQSLVGAVADPAAVGTPHDALLQRWSPDVLAAAGVLSTFGLVRHDDIALDGEADHDLPDEYDWVEHVVAGLPPHELPPLLNELVAVPDLDVVRDDAWPLVLTALATSAELRAAVVEPARVLLADGRSAEVAAYTAWWLRQNARIDGRRLATYALPSAHDLDGLYDVLDPAALGDGRLDAAFLAAVGVRSSLEALLAEPGGPDDLLQRLTDEDAAVSDEQLTRLYLALSTVDASRVTPPDAVRVNADAVVPAGAVVVVDEPHHLQLQRSAPPLVVPLSAAARLADVLDVPTSSERLTGTTVPRGHPQRVPEFLRRWLRGGPDGWEEHDTLVVDGQEVEWWVGEDGTVHACTLDGVARALAWVSRRWEVRLLIAAVLADPERTGELEAEARLEG